MPAYLIDVLLGHGYGVALVKSGRSCKTNYNLGAIFLQDILCIIMMTTDLVGDGIEQISQTDLTVRKSSNTRYIKISVALIFFRPEYA